MRISLSVIILTVLITIISNNTYGQAKIGCMDKAIRVQSQQLKHDFKAQGLEVYKDAMISMGNKEPFPVAVQLTAGEQYEFIFTGNKNADKLYFELYDGHDKKLAEKVVENTGKNNYILYAFIPQMSDLYLIVLSQKVKGKKEYCGSFTVMRKPVTSGQ